MSPKLTLKSTLPLSNTHTLPILGFGVWDSPQTKTLNSCLSALKLGYRHIDTAQVYANEHLVGEAIAQSHIPRAEIFVTSKILGPGEDDEATYAKCLESVRKCGGYLDLLLVHNVTEGLERLWRGMERCVREGKVGSIGVSNLGVGMVEEMRAWARVWPPCVVQLELHPWCQQREIVAYCEKHGIVVEAYCPLVRNQKAEDPTLKAIAERHGKSTAQVLIRYCLQKGWVPLPKSDNPERIAQNADVFDFELGEDEMRELDAKDQGAEGALVMVADNERRS